MRQTLVWERFCHNQSQASKEESSTDSNNPSSAGTEAPSGNISQEFMLAYRSSVHESTGVSPCEMTFGRNVSLPVDLVLGRLPT